MKKMMIAFSALGLVFLTSCGGKSEAVEATEAKDTATASAEAKTFYVDNVVSNVTWRGYKIHETSKEEQGHHGFVKLASGEVSVKEGKLESGNFVIDISTFESMDLNEDPESKGKLDGHLRNPDFLDVEKYPTGTFEITKISENEGDYNSMVEGNLNLRNAPKNISFPANIEVTEEGVTIKSDNFEIDRKDFGVEYAGGYGWLVQDNVGIQIDVTATADKPEEVEAEPTDEPTEEPATEEAHS